MVLPHKGFCTYNTYSKMKVRCYRGYSRVLGVGVQKMLPTRCGPGAASLIYSIIPSRKNMVVQIVPSLDCEGQFDMLKSKTDACFRE